MHWIVLIPVTVPFGTATYFIFMSSIVNAYRSVTGCARMCNMAMRTIFAVAFPLFVVHMYNRSHGRPDGAARGPHDRDGTTAIRAPARLL